MAPGGSNAELREGIDMIEQVRAIGFVAAPRPSLGSSKHQATVNVQRLSGDVTGVG